MNDEPVQVPSSGRLPPGLDADGHDEALAKAARARYRTDGIVGMEPDDGMRSVLGRGEELLAVREDASVERLAPSGRSPLTGRLAITTERLLMIGAQPETVAALDELDEVTLVSDRLLVMLTSGAGVAITVARPMLLRVELAAARARRLQR